MHISKVEQLTGLSRANVRFYEKEGLICPARLENGYRDYSPEDVDNLKRIRLLRELGVPLEEIRQVITGAQTLRTLLEAHMIRVEKEKEQKKWALETCACICRAGEEFSHLDAERYLQGQALRSHGAEKQPPLKAAWTRDVEPFTPHPWKRFFARMVDLTVCGTLSNLLLNGFGRLHVSLLDSVFALLLMLVSESVLLHLCGTTIGKWLFGIFVSEYSGKKLSLRATFARTGQVLLRGMGLQLFGLNFLLMYFARRHYLERHCTPWDYENEVRFAVRSKGRKRAAAALGVMLLLLCGITHRGVYQAQWLPPNRGNITISQFSENYNAIAKADSRAAGSEVSDALLMDLLDAEGTCLGEAALPEGVAVIDLMENEAPRFCYTLENGCITAVSFEADSVVNGLFSGYQQEMRRIIFALSDVRLLNGSIPRLDARTTNMGFKDHAWELYGVRVTCQVTWDGQDFAPIAEEIYLAHGEESRYRVSFRAEKIKTE